MIALMPRHTDPLQSRVDRDGFKAVVSWMVAKCVSGDRDWAPTSRAVFDLPLTDPEALHLQHIANTVGSPRHLPALVDYVTFLQRSEGLALVALHFAELTRDHVGVSGELLIELGMLYRKTCQWEDAEQTWRHLERLGNERWTVRAWIGLGMIARHKGNLGKAEEWFIQAAAAAYHFTDLRAMAVNNLGHVYDHMQPPRYEDAALQYWDAYFLHADPILRYSCLMNVGTAARGARHFALANACFRIVIRHSECWADVTNSLIERVDVCSALHDWEGVSDARDLLRFRFDRFTPDYRVDYEYRMGLVELRRGRDPSPHWQTAYDVAHQHHLGEWTMKLDGLLSTPLITLQSTYCPEPVDVPRLQAVYIDAELQACTAGA